MVPIPKKRNTTINIRVAQTKLFIVGGNLAFKCETILDSSGERIVWLEEDTETKSRTISMNIRDKDNNVFLTMEGNQWSSDLSLVDDVDSSARGQKLKVVATDKGVWYEIIFRSVDMQTLEDLLVGKLGASKQLFEIVKSDMVQKFSGEAPICILKGTFFVPQKLNLQEDKMVFGNMTTKGCNYVGASNTAFSFN